MADRRTLDPYSVLDIARDASPLQVARAHRRLAKRHHPDIHGALDATATERMRRINEAYQLLSNPVRRADYDRRHPSSATQVGGHWAASRHSVRPSAPTSTRTWATWRASAAETRAAPRTVRPPGEVPIVRTRRPPLPEAESAGFLQTGWAALVVAALLVLLVITIAFAGNIGRPPQPF